jgi:hypothetical protein
MELSENYKDFIVELSILRAVSEFKDIESDDFILIYPYLWTDSAGDDADAYLSINLGNSKILDKVPESVLNEANTALNKFMDELQTQ